MVFEGVRRVLHKHENILAFLFMISFALIWVAYSAISSYNVFSLSNFSINLEFFLILTSVLLAVAASYFMLKYLDQERNLQLFDGETVLLTSNSPATYAVIMSVGDQDTHLSPIRSNIFLTNFGIVVEPKNMPGEIALFVPYDMIRQSRRHQNGLVVRYMDVKGMFIEALFIVDGRQMWLDKIAAMTSGNIV